MELYLKEKEMSKVILVTGGSRGIGAAVCIRAAHAGYKVAINYRKDIDAADQLINQLTSAGKKAIAVQADVSNEADVVRMFEDVTEKIGSPSALVNCAGVGGKHMLVTDFERENLELLMKVNVVGTMLCCREAKENVYKFWWHRRFHSERFLNGRNNRRAPGK